MIYMDNSATTAPLPEVVQAANRAMTDAWGNPSSTHAAGLSARALLEDARKQVSLAMGVRRETEGKVFFTSSGTEADNLAILGSVYAKKRPEKNGSRGKILSTDSEHPAVDMALARLEEDGFTVCRIPTRGGVLDMDALSAQAEGAILATMMLVNNESGALYDIKRAFARIRTLSPDCVTHVDAVQGLGKVKFSPAQLGADMISVSAHKIGGLKGVGALYVSADVLKKKQLIPTMPGGGQETGMRSGTENMVGIAGFGEAARLSRERFEENLAAVTAVRQAILAGLPAAVADARVNEPASYIPHIISLTIPGVKSEVMLNHLSARGICVSAGSACSARARHISRAMTAFGLSTAEADNTIRISLCPQNTPEEAASLLCALEEGGRRLRR